MFGMGGYFMRIQISNRNNSILANAMTQDSFLSHRCIINRDETKVGSVPHLSIVVDIILTCFSSWGRIISSIGERNGAVEKWQTCSFLFSCSQFPRVPFGSRICKLGNRETRRGSEFEFIDFRDLSDRLSIKRHISQIVQSRTYSNGERKIVEHLCS